MKQQQQEQLVGTKSRRHMPQELFGRFSSKADFIRYFRDNSKLVLLVITNFCAVQLYLPPDYMLNKDFLKAVLMEKKTLLPLKEVKYVNVPFYDELSVVKIWPMVQNDPDVMKYFPAKLPKGRVPDRTYFFNILNTRQSAYID